MEGKLTLFELNQQIKESLSSAIPGTVWVMAEIAEMKENRNGHCYLDLAEKKGTEIIARARATIWSYTYRILKPYFESTTGQLFTQGLKVLLEVSVDYHPLYGLSLNIKDIDPAYTIGDMTLQRRETIDRLQREGVFNMNKELILPLVPQHIAIISSKTAAGYQDFVNQLENNPIGIKFHTHLFEAYMQGGEAAPSIIAALEKIFEYEDFFDAVAIIRGGGATADLSCFDQYQLALVVTQFPLPVITGIGHEKDDTIIDLVAHTRLKTPTAVAEFFIAGAEIFLEKLSRLKEKVVNIARKNLEIQQKLLENYAGALQLDVTHFIHEKNKFLVKKGSILQHEVTNFSYNKRHELSNLKHNLRSSYSHWNNEKKNKLEQQKTFLIKKTEEKIQQNQVLLSRTTLHLKNGLLRFLTKEQERINLNESKVRLLKPENVLKRGYTLTIKDKKIIKSILPLQVHDEIETRFADGKITSRIIKKDEA
ncbi:MAG: exodeoxyribonuclease VII large subunit [Mariniphaga sp.]|nr:exodeoxyribonuclease VII large subunit [Mariniphaga sp.]MDD4226552.1 exodeoxyribonuclease VII large subunit [Mariniphaga sp.]